MQKLRRIGGYGMKNFFRAAKICLAATAVVCLAACGTPDTAENPTQAGMTPAEYATAARKSLEEANSYKGAVNVVSKMQDSNDSTEVTVSQIKEPFCMQITEVLNSQGGQSYSTQRYLEAEDANVNLFMNYNNQWTEMSLEKEAAEDSVQIYDVRENMITLLQHASGWQETAREKKQVTLQGTLPAADVYAVVEGGKLLQLAGMSGITENYYEGVADVPVTFTFKEDTGEAVSCYMDLGNVLQTVTNNVLKELQADSAGIAVQEYGVTMDISDLNGVQSIEIPVEAQSAINYEQKITSMNESDAA